MHRDTINTAAIGFRRVLHLAERDGERCGGVVMLAGLVIGFGLVQLSSGTLGQTSRFSLELLILMVLQLMGPLLVNVLAMALLLPGWLEPPQQAGPRAWRQTLPAAALVGALLLLLLLLTAMLGGVLASPRADLVGEVNDLYGGLMIGDVMRAMLRCAVFLSALCCWSQWRGTLLRRRGLSPTRVSSNLLVEGLVLLLILKLVWITAIDPLRLSSSAQ